MPVGFFESRFHAYMGMSWYFTIFAIVNIMLGIWGLSIIDDAAVAADGRPGPGSKYDCAPINKFARLLGSETIVEAMVCGILVFGVLQLVHGLWWAVLAVVTFTLYGLLVFLKAVAVLLGVIWLWGDAKHFCSGAVGPLYNHVDLYLKVCLVVVTFQYTFGTFCLISCGLHHAVDEALHQLRGRDDDDL